MPFEGKYEYICFPEPSWGREGDEDDDDEDSDEEDEQEAENKEKKGDIWEKPAAEHPEHKYIMMRTIFEMLSENCKETMQSDPDLFGMYVYNDFVKYAVLELVENLCQKINACLKKDDLHEAWATVACLAQFVLHNAHDGQWLHADDGYRVMDLSKIVGCALLACLNAVERVGELKVDSKFRDLGLVMALFFSFATSAHDVGAECEVEGVDLTGTVASYAKKAGIDLTEVGVSDMERALKATKTTKAKAIKGSATATRWGYAKMCDEYMRNRSVIGPVMGPSKFNITKWSRAERAKYAFDNEDPLKDISEEDIKSGNLMPC